MIRISVAEELLRRKTVCYKKKEMLVTMYDGGSQLRDSVQPLADVSAAGDAGPDINVADADVTDTAASDRVLVKVSNIPSHMSEEMVRMVFENKRYGGGDIETWEFCQSENTAVIEFESSEG